jgi:hypothetical protein
MRAKGRVQFLFRGDEELLKLTRSWLQTLDVLRRKVMVRTLPVGDEKL